MLRKHAPSSRLGFVPVARPAGTPLGAPVGSAAAPPKSQEALIVTPAQQAPVACTQDLFFPEEIATVAQVEAAVASSAPTSVPTAPKRVGFVPPTVVRPLPTAGDAAAATPAVSCYYGVMHTPRSTKKHKVYSDGVLIANGKALVLMEMDGRQVTRASGCKEMVFRVGAQLEVARHEVEIMSEIPADEYESGRLFLSATSLPAEPAPAKLGKTSRASHMDDAADENAAPTATKKPLGAFRPPAHQGGAADAGAVDAQRAPFVPARPASGAAVALRAPAASHPRHDPFAADAVVLQWPSGTTPGESGPKVAASDTEVAVVVDPILGSKLRPHQREGVRFLWDCVQGISNGSVRGCILADDMGLGKSLQVIALLWTMLKQSSRPGSAAIQKAFIVCPASLVMNWRNEFKKWLGDERCRPLAVNRPGAEAAAQVADFMAGSHTVHPVLIISYEMLRKNIDTICSSSSAARIGILVCDEAHRLKSAAGNKTMDALAALPVQRRVLLTGTPVQNNLTELFAMASFANPGILGDLAVFRRVFINPIMNGRDASAKPAEMALATQRSTELSATLAKFVIRRHAAILEKYLPPKTEAVVFCRLSELQADLYAKAVAVGRGRLGDGAVFVLLHALRKICIHPELVHPRSGLSAKAGAARASSAADNAAPLPVLGELLDGGEDTMTSEGAGEDAGAADSDCDSSQEDDSLQTELASVFPREYRVGAVRDHSAGVAWLESFLAHSGKLFVVDQLLRHVRSTSKDKIVLVSNFTQVLDLLESVCRIRQYPFCRLDGTMATAKRAEVVAGFNTPGSSTFVFLLSAQAGGVGLNLIAANRLVLCDSSWNPAVDRQALARVWRDGQTKHTYVFRLVTTHSIEEKVLQRQLLKESMANAVGSGDAASTAAGGASMRFSSEELKALFALNPRDPAPCDTLAVINEAQRMAARAGSRAGAVPRRGASTSSEAAPEADEVDSVKPLALEPWSDFTGPSSLVDASLRAACSAAHAGGEPVVSYVRQVCVNTPAAATVSSDDLDME